MSPRRVWHLIEGEAGTRYAAENSAVAIIVDALRASATAAALLEHGAAELVVVKDPESALELKQRDDKLLLYGERNGLPPPGFDGGNSPRLVGNVAGRRIGFTTTTGALRLLQAHGAPAVYMGSTVNASAVAALSRTHDAEIVLIPAGLTGHSDWLAQEDWVAATAIAIAGGVEIEGKGADTFDKWRRRIESEGIQSLFENAPHAEKLRRVGLEADIGFCSQMDLYDLVPWVYSSNVTAAFVRAAKAGVAAP